MTTEDLTTPVPVPGILWVGVKWACGILATGFVATVVILVNAAIGFSGRLSALERDGDTLREIKTNTEVMRASMEEVKRDVAVLKARQP